MRYGNKKAIDSVNGNLLTSTFQKLRGRLRGMATGIVGNKEDADDVLHDAFCRLWTRYSDLDNEGDAEKLSYTAVYSASIDSLRRSKVRQALSIDNISDLADNEDEDSVTDLYNNVLNIAYGLLSANQREVFRLHDVQGLEYGEVARQLGMTQENVRMTLSRARKAIRQHYRDQQQIQ